MRTKILGISFSTRMVGLAVLDSDLLIDYSVKFYKEKWSPAKMESILTSLTSAVTHYNIQHIVLSIAPAYINEDPYNELWQEIIMRFEESLITVTSYKLESLQQITSCEERMSRKLLMETLCEKYPELSFYARLERRNKNKYYYKMFEAVGVILLHRKINNNTAFEKGEG